MNILIVWNFQKQHDNPLGLKVFVGILRLVTILMTTFKYALAIHDLMELHAHLANILHPDKLIIKIPHRVTINTQLTLRIPIPHKRKPIPAQVLNLIILPPNIPQHLKIMQSTPRINSRNRTMFLPLLKPRSTR
jgi:hypothetical protein